MEELTFCVGYPFPFKIYARVNNKIFIERYICYAGFTLYTSNMYTCKYVYFRKDMLKDIQLHV